MKCARLAWCWCAISGPLPLSVRPASGNDVHSHYSSKSMGEQRAKDLVASFARLQVGLVHLTHSDITWQ